MQTLEKVKKYPVGLFSCEPGLTAERLRAWTKDLAAVVLIAFATGSTPHVLNEANER